MRFASGVDRVPPYPNPLLLKLVDEWEPEREKSHGRLPLTPTLSLVGERENEFFCLNSFRLLVFSKSK